jgi:hypothetical protein
VIPLFSRTVSSVCNPFTGHPSVWNIFWSDAKKTKAMVKETVEKMGARDCSCLDSIAIPCRSSHTVIGNEILQKLKQWLSPPDTSTNYTFGLRAIHEETATWFLEGRIFQEWHSTGSLLWINGKCTFLETCRSPVPDGSRRSSHS